MRAGSGGCALRLEAGVACPCESWPARVRRALGVPLPLNAASAEELDLLPGIGPARARAIVEERRRGAYRAVEELERASGIGPATVARLRGELFTGEEDPACAAAVQGAGGG